MFTYFSFFLAIVILLAVFGRRFYVTLKRFSQKKEPVVIKEKTEEIIQKVSREDKNKAGALFEKGQSLLKAGKEEEAIKSFVQALAMDQNHLDTQTQLALLYMQKEMYGAAAALFKSLAETTNDALHYSHLGLALYQQNNFEEALSAYQKSVALDSSRPQRFISLTMVYKSMGQPQTAIISLNKALELDSENLDFLFLKADIQAEMGDFSGANQTLKKILSVDSENPDVKTLLKKIENQRTSR